MTTKCLLFCLMLSSFALAQNPAGDPRWATGFWDARWIIPSGIAAKAYGVYHFRKQFSLEKKPTRFLVHVSADNRYRLFLNGKPIGLGPARSDAQHWFYDTYDLAPLLTEGPNVIAAQVWNMGEHAPAAQMTYQTGFIVQGDGAAEKIVNTNNSWKATANAAYQPLPNDIAKLRTYIVVGAGDLVDGKLYPWGWETRNFDDIAWKNAQIYWFNAKTRGNGSDGNWMLAQRTIPPMEVAEVRLSKARRVVGIPPQYVDDFLSQKTPLTIPKNQKTTILFDQSHLTNAYPELTVSGGKNAKITLAYAEALVDDKRQKGHRDSIDGKKLVGFEDAFIADGGDKRLFRPLWLRTYRYLEMTVETSDEPLIINDLRGEFTGYPFVEKGRFSSNDAETKRIWDVGWRTARLCAGETYYDCPYYEQLQYTGDTRIQALISLYAAGDDRLMRKAIQDYDNSRFSDGLTQSRYPCNDMQVIPTFSLFWVSMVHDFWMHRRDDAFVKSMLRGVESVIDWHENRYTTEGLNGQLQWWNFVDWAWEWNETDRIGGVPAGSRTGSSVLSLQFAYTLRQAAALMRAYGQAQKALHYEQLSAKINQTVYRHCWNAARGLLSDTPDQKLYSQHANIWGVLTDAIPQAQQKAVLRKIMVDTGLTQATFYFKFYLFQALKKTKMGDAFMAQLKPWRQMLAMGLTTFAEKGEPTRSDCHAWSAAPNYEFLSTVCGINPAEAGFKKVVIEPYLGGLTQVEGSVPHPLGDIVVQFAHTEGSVLSGNVTLPKGLTGVLKWGGKTQILREGSQKVALR